ncbi:hypothetical protein BDC45DRAFT_515737 [Circinella umbellata]|nr:hypothetical protein BDC45DRAFT_515737 [Circinella umbellata]
MYHILKNRTRQKTEKKKLRKTQRKMEYKNKGKWSTFECQYKYFNDSQKHTSRKSKFRKSILLVHLYIQLFYHL